MSARETPLQIATRIIYEENTAIVPDNKEWLMHRIAQAIETDRRLSRMRTIETIP